MEPDNVAVLFKTTLFLLARTNKTLQWILSLHLEIFTCHYS